jgi:hypothetical protein
MPAVSLDTAGAAELAELLHFLGDWPAADRDRLDASLRRLSAPPATTRPVMTSPSCAGTWTGSRS